MNEHIELISSIVINCPYCLLAEKNSWYVCMRTYYSHYYFKSDKSDKIACREIIKPSLSPQFEKCLVIASSAGSHLLLVYPDNLTCREVRISAKAVIDAESSPHLKFS